jgi:outer membrane protein assembly factor BamB
MRPLLTSQRLFARLLYGESPALVCFDRSHGRLQWKAQLPQDDVFISDPFLLQGQLAALTLTRDPQGGLLGLTKISGQNGQIIDRHDLARIRAAWWQRPGCQVASLDDGFVASLTGLIVAGDSSGNVRWLRRTMVLPVEEDPSWVLQYRTAPLVDGDRLYVAQVGTGAVQCLDRRSGRQLWSNVVPDIRRIAGIAAGHLILDCEHGLSAFDLPNGAPAWRCPLTGARVNLWLDDETVFYVGSRIARDSRRKFGAELVWLDARIGRVYARAVLDDWEQQQPLLGPAVLADQRLWALAGSDEEDFRRDLLELSPQGEPSERLAVDNPRVPWLDHVPDSLQGAAARLFPGWTLLSAEPIAADTSRAAELSTVDVLATRAGRDSPLVLARHTTLPDGGRPRLRLRLADSPRNPCAVEVRFDGNSLFEEEVSGRRGGQQLWRTLDVDLAPVAGRTGWLTVRARTLDNRTWADIFWKQVDIAY